MQLPIVIFKNRLFKTCIIVKRMYMYIDFQQNRVSKSVKLTVHINIFAENRKLHKFATTNSNFEKIDCFRHALS